MSFTEGKILAQNIHLLDSEDVMSKNPALLPPLKQKSSKKSLPPVPKFSDEIVKKNDQEGSTKIIEEKNDNVKFNVSSYL